MPPPAKDAKAARQSKSAAKKAAKLAAQAGVLPKLTLDIHAHSSFC